MSNNQTAPSNPLSQSVSIINNQQEETVMSNIQVGPDSLSVIYNSDIPESEVYYVNLYNMGAHVRQDKGTGTKINIGEYVSKDKVRRALTYFAIQGTKKDTLGHKSFIKGIAKAVYSYAEDGTLTQQVLQAPGKDEQRDGLWMKYQFTQTKALDFISLVETASGLPIFNEAGEVEQADWDEQMTPDEETGVKVCRLDWQLVLKVSRKVGYSASKDSKGEDWSTVNSNAWNIHGIMLVGPEHELYFYNQSQGEDLLEVLDILGWVKQESSKGSTLLERMNATRNKAGMSMLSGNAPVAVKPNAPMPVAKVVPSVIPAPVPAAAPAVEVIKWVAPSGKKDIMKSSIYGQLVAKVNEYAAKAVSKDDVWVLGANGTSANIITAMLKAAEANGAAPSDETIDSLAIELAIKVEALVAVAPVVVAPIVVAAPVVEAVVAEEEAVEDEVETFTVASEEIDLDDIEGYFPTVAKVEAPVVEEVAVEAEEVEFSTEDAIPSIVSVQFSYSDEEDEEEVIASPSMSADAASDVMSAIDPAAIMAALKLAQAQEFSATISADDSDDDDEI